MATQEDITGILCKPRRIVVTTHHKPDGDALGSSLGIYHWLSDRNHDVQVIVPSDFPHFLDWMPGRDKLIVYTEEKERADQLIAEADLIFCLDFNSLSRINAMQEVVANASALKVMIDHHLEPDGFEDYRYWDSSAAATAQLVYDFISSVCDDNKSITPEVATCLYTGIMTDTGSFRFRATTASVHQIIADLITKGAKNWQIHEHIYNNNTENRLKFLGYALLNRLEVIPEYHTAIIHITKKDLQKFDIITGDTEGLVNYALSIGGMRLAALIIDRGDLVKLSLRSIGDFPCNEVCKFHFDGGGHLNAAGGSSKASLPQVVDKFKTVLTMYKEQLT